MLGKYGFDVECIDLFGVDEESIDFNKIVRDYIPADIQARGEGVETVRLVGDALVEAIKRKLVDESFEVSDAKTADSIAEELADVQEVIDALAAVLNIQKRKISDIQQRKRDKRGGFTDGLMLIRPSIDPPVDRKSTRLKSRHSCA